MKISDWLVSKIGRWLTRNEPPSRAYLCDFDRIRYDLRPGDVLLVEGRNRISRFIKKITHSPWSHASLYIGRLYDIDDPDLREKVRQHFDGSSDTQLIIESMIGKGTIVTPLSHYRYDHLRICRPQGLSRKDAQQVIGYAISRLGAKYHVRHIFDLARFMLLWGHLSQWHSILFDHKNSQALYDICSSMIADAFHSVNFPILPVVKHDDENGIELIQRHPRLYTPSDFDYSPYFDIIKYPYFSLFEKAPYHHLPWKEGAVSIGEGKDLYLYKDEEAEQNNEVELPEITENPSPDTDQPAEKETLSHKPSEAIAELLKKMKSRRTNGH